MAGLSLSLVKIHLMLLTLFVCNLTCWAESESVSISPRPKVQYTRTEQVKAMCPTLTPREPQVDEMSNVRLRQRLRFQYGDWEEAEHGSTSIVPFLQWDDSALPAKIKLASFLVTDVASSGKDKRVRKLQGIMQLAIMDGQSPFPATAYEASFKMDRGLSVLNIEVEGIYQQAENEDVVCLLGCTFLPSPDGGLHFPNIQNSLGTKPLEKNCDIQVELNYPIKYNLNSQVVRGTIHSLVAPGGRYSFSPITFSSQLKGRIYNSADEDLVNEACPVGSPSGSELAVSAYKGSFQDFCYLSFGYLRKLFLDIEPNWGCNATSQNCWTIGPFDSYGARTSYVGDYNTSRARIWVNRWNSNPCFMDSAPDENPLSFVLRLVPAHERDDIARVRSGLDGHTLVAEGHLNNHSRSLCMVACKVDDASGQPSNCNFQVSLHNPLFLSITQRNVFKGKITSLLAANDPASFFPLSFNAKLHLNTRHLPYQYTSSLRYNYSRLDHAGAVLDKYEPESRSRLKTTPWFKYPSLIGEEVGHYQSLADDLTFQYHLKPKTVGQKWSSLKFELVAMDKYLPFLWSGFVVVPSAVFLPVNDTIVTQTDPNYTHRLQEARKYLNCSGTLEFSGEDDEKLTIFTEGLYNPLDGQMYMVGCRSVKASFQQIVDRRFELDEGMDCEIEIVLKYPTSLSAWLTNPGVEVKVHSNRPVDDLFHFDDIDTETDPVLYKGQRETIISRKNIEGALSILTLSLTLVCIVSQLLYIQSREESTPYISLSMLAAQAIGYAIPLITGAESLLARKFDYRKDYLFQESGSVQFIIYLDKILTLLALLLFLRLFEKVWRERKSLSELGVSANVPRERSVVLICFIIHAIGFVSVLGLHSRHPVTVADDITKPLPVDVPSTQSSHQNANFTLFPVDMDGFEAIRKGPLWQVSQEYTGLIEDLFLLPQAVGFSLWDVTGKPLRVSFFVGLTFLQIVPHVYDYLRSTRFRVHDSPIYADPSFDFYTHSGNILIPALALVFAVLVYCQQRWKGFLRFPRRFQYEPLGTKRGETELVSTNGRGHLPPIPEDDE